MSEQKVYNYEQITENLLKELELYPGLIDLMKKCRVMICGGAINSVFTNRKINDYDLYFRDMEDCTYFYESLKKIPDSISPEITAFKLINITDNAATFKSTVLKTMIQVISAEEMIKETPQEVFELFDWTVCMGAYDFLTESFVLHDKFLEDIEKKRLTFNPGTLFPICSLYRSIKYQKRGYHLTGVSTIKLSLTINELHMESYRDLKRQLMGIDTLFLQELTNQWVSGDMADKAYDAQEAMNLIEKYLEQKLVETNGEENDF